MVSDPLKPQKVHQKKHFRQLLLSECVHCWHGPGIQCVVSSFHTATTMDRSFLHLTAHLAGARGGQAHMTWARGGQVGVAGTRGGQAPLVADAFNAACP